MRAFVLILAITVPVIGQDKPVTLDETFNPDSLEEPVLDWPVMLRPGNRIQEKEPAEADSTEEGYRIQVISTQNLEQADSLKRELAAPFNDQVYITFDPPNYKVRVGNYRFRSDAEKAQLTLEKMGYRTAWIIRTRIVVRPDSSRR